MSRMGIALVPFQVEPTLKGLAIYGVYPVRELNEVVITGDAPRRFTPSFLSEERRKVQLVTCHPDFWKSVGNAF